MCRKLESSILVVTRFHEDFKYQ